MSTGTKKHIEVLWKIVLAVACTIMFFMILGVEAKAAEDEFSGTTFTELQSCINNNNGNTIKLMNDVTAGNGESGLTIVRTITIDLNGHIINRNLTSAVREGYVIRVSGGTLTIIDSNPNFDHSTYSASLGAISFTGGGIIGGNTSSLGGGIYLMNATLNMYGGTISSCSANEGGGGVYVKASVFTMNGGTIASCATNTKGGGVYAVVRGTFTMNGGTITSCNANTGGGGVYQKESTFTMDKGEISFCTANNGGGVYVENTEFDMNGGIITGCEAIGNGGGIYCNGDSATVNLSGGTISACTAPNCPDIYASNPAKVTVTSRVLVRDDLINTGIVFDGTDKQLIDGDVVSVTGSALSLKYAVMETNSRPGSGAFTTGFPAKKEVGTYYVWYVINNSSTGETFEGGPLVVSIGQATPGLATTPAGVTGLTANNTSRALITGGTAQAFGSYTPEVKYAVTRTNSRPATGYSSDIPSETAAGTYYVWYMIEGTRNWSTVNTFNPITVVIGEPATEPDNTNVTPDPAPAPVIVTPVNDPEPAAEKVNKVPDPSIFTRKNKDGSVTTIKIIWNEDGTTTVITETVWPDGSVLRKEETRDAKGNGTLKIEKKDGKGNLLSSTEGTIKVNKKGTETIKSTTENADGSGSEKTQKTYKRDPEADNIKKVTISEKKTDAEGNKETIKTTALVGVLGDATITEKSEFTVAAVSENETEENIAEERKTDTGKDSSVEESMSDTVDDGNKKARKVVNEKRQYSLSVNGRLKLTSLTTNGEKLAIPESIELDGMTRVVKAVGKNALKGNRTLKEVVLGENITTINTGAFKNCKNLELIELTGSVKTIYKNAFKGIAENAKFVIEASEVDFERIRELLRESGVGETVIFERIK